MVLNVVRLCVLYIPSHPAPWQVAYPRSAAEMHLPLDTSHLPWCPKYACSVSGKQVRVL